MSFEPARHYSATALSGLVVAALLGAGITWRECVLLGVAVFAGHRIFLWRMDLGAPWDGWRAGLRCVVAGALGLVASVAVIVALLIAQSGLWLVDHGHAFQTLVAIAAAGVLLSGVQLDSRGRLMEAAIWTALFLAAVVVFEEARRGRGFAPCVLTGALACWMAWRSWDLARGSARALLRAA